MLVSVGGPIETAMVAPLFPFIVNVHVVLPARQPESMDFTSVTFQTMPEPVAVKVSCAPLPIDAVQLPEAGMQVAGTSAVGEPVTEPLPATVTVRVPSG